MSDTSGRHPADSAVPSEPKQAVVKVPPCLGCGGLPHPSPTKELLCLRDALVRSREETAAARQEVESTKSSVKRDVDAARAEARELRWELGKLRGASGT